MALSKKTYEALATALASVRPPLAASEATDAWQSCVRAVESVMRQQAGPGGFNSDRFATACRERMSYREGA